MAEVRKFNTGATRDGDKDKLDYEGFLSPLVLERYAQYLHKHRKQSDGAMRESDNWQKGIPLADYMRSMWRHLIDVWKAHRGLPVKDRAGNPVSLEDSLCGLLFNASGYLHELLKMGSPPPPGRVSAQDRHGCSKHPAFPSDRCWICQGIVPDTPQARPTPPVFGPPLPIPPLCDTHIIQRHDCAVCQRRAEWKKTLSLRGV